MIHFMSMKQHLLSFTQFVREQGVVGLAVGFILGGAVSKVVSSIVNDLINPLLGIALGAVGNLQDLAWTVGGARVAWGNFLATTIDFVVIAAVVYFGFRCTGLTKLDKPKS